MQSLWRTVWQFLIKLNKYLPYTSWYLPKRNVSYQNVPRTVMEINEIVYVTVSFTESKHIVGACWIVFSTSFQGFGRNIKSTGFAESRLGFIAPWLHYPPIRRIHSNFLSTYSVPGTLLGVGGISWNRIVQAFTLMALIISWLGQDVSASWTSLFHLSHSVQHLWHAGYCMALRNTGTN